ncbi:hypothetical protein [Oceanospirillum sediminis]|uniref:LPP20 lipoprotein n=1 Tax=Oceanospirillum sediminis TaxID=2760088 RepID=A0A839IPP4_9GAMM|nr:hypothetical protein [Oceanospirillum sediminis]MBB1487225.1 hypothetical protein [Oceanospirillum sediminis]
MFVCGRKRNLIGLALISWSLLGCGLHSARIIKTERPGWIEQRPERQGHLYGVGFAGVYDKQSDVLDQARLQARYQLERQLIRSYKTGDQGRVEHGHNLSDAIYQLFTDNSGDVDLPGLDWQAQWHDERQNQIYVLAHLNRRFSAGLIAQQIKQLDDRLSQLVRPVSMDSRVQKRRVMQQLMLFAERYQKAELFRWVSGSEEGKSLTVPLLQKQEQLLRILNNTQICLQPGNSLPPSELRTIRQSVTQAGFTLAGDRICSGQEGVPPDLELEFDLSIERQQRDNHYQTDSDGIFDIKDNQGNVLLTFHHRHHLMADSSEQAEKLTVQELSSMLQQSVLKSFILRKE